MNNWCICWSFTHIFTGILIFKRLTARRLYKSFGVKGLIKLCVVRVCVCVWVCGGVCVGMCVCGVCVCEE
jgi:hypothetical protein